MALSQLVIQDKAALVGAFEQDHPHIGQAVGIDGGERHGLGIDRLGGLGLGHPGAEQGERVRGFGEIGPLAYGSGLVVHDLKHPSRRAQRAIFCRNPCAERAFTFSSL